MFIPHHAIKSTLIAVSLALGTFSLNAQAALISYTSNGADLVYSTVSDVTWTKDANLFKTMYDADNTLISKIAAVTPTYNDSWYGLQTISDGALGGDDSDDFNTSNGRATWWGALAFVNYLNHISYAGSTSWYLPTASYGYDDVFNNTTNGTAKGDELLELFYGELGGTAGGIIANISTFDTTTFDNERFVYWIGTEYASDYTEVYRFATDTGGIGTMYKSFQFYAWAVSPGQIAAVPEPESVAMLLFGLGVIGATLRRRQQQSV